MSEPTAPGRLDAVSAIRAHQRSEIGTMRERVAGGGGQFAVTSSDEFEEILALFGIPSVVYNYWNFVVVSQRKAPHFSRVLEEHGYPGPHFFALGYGTALDPDEAPWGGLPRPTIVIGSGRSERELRVTELWANEAQAEFLPVDFNMGSAAKKELPKDWYGRIRAEWRQLVDQERLELRVQQNRAVVDRLKALTGRTVSTDDIRNMMGLVDRQMDLWMEANRLIVDAEDCPVDFRDQMSMYQAMWHRGTDVGVTFIEAYRDEVAERVAAGVSAYGPPIDTRLLYWSMREEPRTHAYMNEHGAAIVAALYSSIPALYARDVGDDPWEALAARNLFLFDLPSANWLLAEVERTRVDAVLLIEDADAPPSLDRQALEAAGVPVLLLPDTGDTDASRRLIDEFLQSRHEREPA